MNLEKFNFSTEEVTSVSLRGSNHCVPLLPFLCLLLSCGGRKGSIIFHLETSSYLNTIRTGCFFLPCIS